MVHFSHLKTAAGCDYLTFLYVWKVNSALSTGDPLARWSKSLVVLLEKDFGSILSEKLRSIILFEADFNWLQKIVFSNRMSKLARKHNLIPQE